MTNIDGARYLIEVGRKNRAIYAALTNYKTAERAELLLDEAVIGTRYAAGWFYDYPCFSQVSGTAALLKRVYATCKTDVYMMFCGNSITQGYGVAHDTGWAKKAADYFGNSQTVGRSGGVISYVVRQIRDLTPVLRPRVIVVTIGTNGGASITLAQLKALKAQIEATGAIPVINCIWPRPDEGTGTTLEVMKALNEMILSLGVISARFDIATSIDHDINQGGYLPYFPDGMHLGTLGNQVTFERFIADCKLPVKAV
jgi:hypothetical protein